MVLPEWIRICNSRLLHNIESNEDLEFNIQIQQTDHITNNDEFLVILENIRYFDLEIIPASLFSYMDLHKTELLPIIEELQTKSDACNAAFYNVYTSFMKGDLARVALEYPLFLETVKVDIEQILCCQCRANLGVLQYYEINAAFISCIIRNGKYEYIEDDLVRVHFDAYSPTVHDINMAIASGNIPMMNLLLEKIQIRPASYLHASSVAMLDWLYQHQTELQTSSFENIIMSENLECVAWYIEKGGSIQEYIWQKLACENKYKLLEPYCEDNDLYYNYMMNENETAINIMHNKGLICENYLYNMSQIPLSMKKWMHNKGIPFPASINFRQRRETVEWFLSFDIKLTYDMKMQLIERLGYDKRFYTNPVIDCSSICFMYSYEICRGLYNDCRFPESRKNCCIKALICPLCPCIMMIETNYSCFHNCRTCLCC